MASSSLAFSLPADDAALSWATVALGHEEREILPFFALAGLPEQDVRLLHLLVVELPLQKHGQWHAGPVHLAACTSI
ncbi:hypothetical protein PR202_gn00337 [Eleusine coracana subsp. coracana]|uniref:Uncharacterized protein n=1 Tax=Eleusine coracana subsp. coracana TaxID=191504 RepID=A0AAV5G2I1_ELECO|nr:hypothetical protein PR202_gn00337 [Eleusine coracana subsp. coracana]